MVILPIVVIQVNVDKRKRIRTIHQISMVPTSRSVFSGNWSMPLAINAANWPLLMLRRVAVRKRKTLFRIDLNTCRSKRSRKWEYHGWLIYSTLSFTEMPCFIRWPQHGLTIEGSKITDLQYKQIMINVDSYESFTLVIIWSSNCSFSALHVSFSCTSRFILMHSQRSFVVMLFRA